MNTVLELRAKGGYRIRVQQYAAQPHLFCVRYGKQIKVGLTYNEAASELGQALLHAAAAAGKVRDSTEGGQCE
jgi:hypothetical protein